MLFVITNVPISYVLLIKKDAQSAPYKHPTPRVYGQKPLTILPSSLS